MHILAACALLACGKDERGLEEPRGSPPTAPTAPAASPDEAPTPRDMALTWTVPDGWRPYPVEADSPMKAHFTPIDERTPAGDRQVVHVYVIQNLAAEGATADERFRDAEQKESEPFAEITEQHRQTRRVAGLELVLLEISGTMKELHKPPGAALELLENPGHRQITALVPAPDYPYRVVVFGPQDLVERVRDDFMILVDSLRLAEASTTKP